MSDSVDPNFDVEAQESLLESSPTALQVCEASNARKTLLKFILMLRSTELFKRAADINSLSSTSPTDYASITDSHHQLSQDSEIVEESTDSTTHEDTLSVHPSPDRSIELQQIQRENVTEIVRKKNLQELKNYGGVRVVAEALNTDLENGISTTQQTCECKQTHHLSQFLFTILSSFLGAFNNITVFLLSCAGALSLGFGIKEDGIHVGWLNGAIILITVLFIVVGTTIRNCWEARSHKKLENSWGTKGRKLTVRVVRGGSSQYVSEIDLQVGDIVLLQKGDQVLADGLFTSGEGLEVNDGLIHENSPFLFNGSRVMNGRGRMLVTSTVMDTAWVEMMNQASAERECKFESYLHKNNTCVQIAGLLISIVIIVVLFLRYKAGKLDDERRYRPDPRAEPTQARTIMDAIKGVVTGSRGTARVLMTLLSVSLVGIVEGIPLSIALAAILWVSKALGDKASQRDYFTPVKMASLTTIITDKIGVMTEHDKEIDTFCIGEEFVTKSSSVASHVLEGVRDGIGALLLQPPNDPEPELPYIGWAEEKLGMKRETVIARCKMMRQDIGRVLMEKDGNVGYLHCRGRPEDILPMCSHHYDIDGREWEIDEAKKGKLEKAVSRMEAEPSAQVIAYAYKRVEDFDHEASFEPDGLILLAMVSMKETGIEETAGAVSALEGAEIRTILASTHSIDALSTTYQKCGLINGSESDNLVLNAEDFRSWSDEMRRNNVEKVRILGNCLPSDKILLIKSLQERGKVVALVGQTTVDAPALKQADIGIAYGSWSSEVARECCEISIWRGNCFTFLVNIIKSGRCFQENIRKFIQLQLILAISSLLINFIAVVFWGDAPITAVQFFWLNRVVGLVGGLALLTGPSTTTLMTMLPVYKSSDKLITKAMWRNIALQVTYQTAIFISLQYKGQEILGTSGGRVKSVIYNGFFLCQMFNIFIAREPEKKNIFKGLLHNNSWFWLALVIFIICQAGFAMAEELLHTCPGLSYKLWGVCLLIGVVSWLVDWVGKMASNCILSAVNYCRN
ncbi:hypothetical protein ACS0TY_032133 [Phlomoides rotata]